MESRVRGLSGRQDQVGGWGRRRMGGNEEAESRQQEAGRAEGRGQGQIKRAKEKGEGTAPTFI